MRILLSCVPYDGGKSGISVCMREQVAALKAAGHSPTLIVEHDAAGDFPDDRKILLPAWTRRPLFSMLYHLFILPFRIRRRDFDFCLICAANRRALAFYPLPTIAVVHDLSQYHVTAKYDAFRMFYIRHVLPFFVRRAAVAAAISHSTAADLQTFWKIPEGRIRVIPDGLSLPAPQPRGNRGNWRCSLGLKRPYLLYISRLEHPGKNHVRLIRAFRRLPSALAEKYDLVMPGSSWDGAAAVFAEAENGGYADHFHFPGFISSDDLQEAYSGAAGYVFPSLFEGFGLSLIEAMYYGVPCACSATSSLGELGAGCAILFDPENDADIVRALEQLLTDTAGNRERIQAGRLRASGFTWEKNAALTIAVAEELMKRRPEVFGVPVDAVSMETALRQLSDGVGEARRTGHCTMFNFVNAHCLNLAYRDPEYRRILEKSAAVWPDGSGVKLAGRLLGFAVPENVNGTDMFPLLCDGKYSIWLLGAAPGVAAQAAERVRSLFPAARIVGCSHGFFADDDSERRLIEAVNAADPDLLLVALGVPKQEKWMAAHLHELHCGAVIGVGGLLDFISGRIPRAPRLLRRLGMEWIWRLAMEPKRLFRRYVIGNPMFVFRVVKYRFKNLIFRKEK